MQAVYQWQMSEAETAALEAEFAAGEALDKADKDFFKDVLRGVVLRTEELDELLAPILDRTIAQLDCVERAILRLGTFEMKSRPDVPYRAVIDEYVELAKIFGAEDGHKFVNGVLDRIARSQRAAEVAAGGRV